jgi:hypothetical protein
MSASNPEPPLWWTSCLDDMWEPQDYVTPEFTHYRLDIRITHTDGEVMDWTGSLPFLMNNGERWDFSERILTNPPSPGNGVKEVRLLKVTQINMVRDRVI